MSAQFATASVSDDAFSRSRSLRTNGNGKANVYNPSVVVPSPLQNFVKAKEGINTVFVQMHDFINEVATFLCAASKEREALVSVDSVRQSESYSQSMSNIREMLSRDHMKVVFFGRTSNGKSTTINAMLGSSLLPSSIGHTTKCFVQVEGSPTGQQYLLTEGSTTPSKIESIKELAHALCEGGAEMRMTEDTLVRVCWSKDASRLLKNEVVLVDSPGIDLSPESDSWIDKHCLDADVFVLVLNAEATLTHTEKEFFHRVSKRLSKPRIFILNNRWDVSASEPDAIEQVRTQHQTRFLKFLVEELRVCTSDEGRHRIFFVSAREMLTARLRDKGSDALSTPTPFADGFQARAMEFREFERQFEACISETAIKTKFEAHVERGKEIIISLREIFDSIFSRLAEAHCSSSALLEKTKQLFEETQRNLEKFNRNVVVKMQQLSAEVHLRVSHDLTDEINRLESLIDSFNTSQQFGEEPSVLLAYKTSLLNYVDHQINEKLQSRCAGSLLQRILVVENEIVTSMCKILPDSFTNEIGRLIHLRRPFVFTFSLNCPAHCHDFCEDLEFRFSLGLSSLIRRFLSASGRSANRDADISDSQPNVYGPSVIPRSISTPDYPDMSTVRDDILLKSVVLKTAEYVANGGIAVLLICGVVYRCVGWRVIALVSGTYLSLYVYARLSWNQRSKERAFKEQLRNHLARRLRQFRNAVTSSCDAQVVGEVQEFISRVQRVADTAVQQLDKDCAGLQRDVAEQEAISHKLTRIRLTANSLLSQLDGFVEAFLKWS